MSNIHFQDPANALFLDLQQSKPPFDLVQKYEILLVSQKLSFELYQNLFAQEFNPKPIVYL